jgi:hypothetical protein
MTCSAQKEGPAASPPGRPHESDLAAKLISPTSKLESGRGQLVDRYGHSLSESVLTNWSREMLRIMGVRRLDEKGGA